MIAIYARVSTEEQAKHGFSLQDQIRDCRMKAGSGDVIEYVDEGVSGEFLDRPALGDLRRDVRSGLIHKVICLDPDRLSRKLMNQLILSDEIEAQCELVFVNGEYARTPEGQLFYQMRGAISQFEKAKINERMSRGRREKARQGRVLRDFRIYGYDFDANHDRFVVNEREATIVRLIFELFTNPQGRVHGINGIARYLTSLGVPTKRGVGVFHRQVVRQMLMNRAYIGEFYQNRWNTEGMLGNKFRAPEDRVAQKERPREEWIRLPIPPIVDTDQFDLAQTLLAESRRRWAGDGRRRYLLSGLLRCGFCGNTMTGKKQRNWGRDTFIYTDRKTTVGTKNTGCGVSVDCRVLDECVWRAILSWVESPDRVRVDWKDESGTASLEASRLQSLDEEINRVDTTIYRLLKLLSDPDIDEQDIGERLKVLQQHKKQLQTEQLELKMRIEKGPHDRKEDANQSLWMAWEWIKSVHFDDIRLETKQALIRSLVREVRVCQDAQKLELRTL